MKPVLIATDSERRGIFFGYTDCALEEVASSGVIKLTNFRNCIYWSKSIGGVFGLAQTGPDVNCRIGIKVDKAAFFNGVTFVSEVSVAAVESWEKAPCVK